MGLGLRDALASLDKGEFLIDAVRTQCQLAWLNDQFLDAIRQPTNHYFQLSDFEEATQTYFPAEINA